MKKIDKILIIGDLIIDILIDGNVSRINPEAPVPVLDVYKKKLSLGGVGNILDYFFYKNGKAKFVLFIGQKNFHKQIISLTNKYKKIVNKIFFGNVYNILKFRYASNNQYILRVDEHKKYSINTKYKNYIVNFLENKDISYFCISDYDKGIVDELFLSKIIKICTIRGIKIILDTKKKNIKILKNIFLITPNLIELCDLCKLNQNASLNLVIKYAIDLKKNNNIENILISMSEEGAILIDKFQKVIRYAISKKSIYDVTGAGDVLFASIIFNLSKNKTLTKSIEIALKEATSSVGIFGKISENKLELQI